MKLTDFQRFYEAIRELPLAEWHQPIAAKLGNERNPALHGDFARWYDVYANLPGLPVSGCQLNSDTIEIGSPADCSEKDRQRLREQLKQLHPWRKGPYDFFGVHVDTEWRSDWKWQRVAPHISDLAGRLVLDIGCGNGYHCWRMAGANAKFVLGIDPNYLFLMQFQTVKHFLGSCPVYLLPFAIEDMPSTIAAFDTVFSMGVLYHRKSPIEHLLTLRKYLVKGGEVVLETLVIEGEKDQVLVPEGRYAKMRNVWFIPSCEMLKNWMQRVGFTDVRCVDVTRTSIKEQRATEWMRFESLPDFLDPEDSSLTVEGYPGPTRAVFVATNPNIVE